MQDSERPRLTQETPEVPSYRHHRVDGEVALLIIALMGWIVALGFIWAWVVG